LEKLKLRGCKKSCTDVQLSKELEQEVHYWSKVLKRKAAAVKYLSV